MRKVSNRRSWNLNSVPKIFESTIYKFHDNLSFLFLWKAFLNGSKTRFFSTTVRLFENLLFHIMRTWLEMLFLIIAANYPG